MHGAASDKRAGSRAHQRAHQSRPGGSKGARLKLGNPNGAPRRNTGPEVSQWLREISHAASLVSDRLARKLRHLGDLLDADQIAVGGDGRPVNVVTCDCLPSFTIALSSGSITPPPCDPLGPNAQSGRAVAGACGDALANRGHDTRALQAYLGHKNIQHTMRYTELSPTRFKNFWRE